eukprot:611559-Karenia_brevis.AAC.1
MDAQWMSAACTAAKPVTPSWKKALLTSSLMTWARGIGPKRSFAMRCAAKSSRKSKHAIATSNGSSAGPTVAISRVSSKLLRMSLWTAAVCSK